MIYIILFGFISFVMGIIVGLKINTYMIKSTEETPLEKLKNALLSLALMTVKPNKISKNLNYSKYNGNELPFLSGSSIENACFTYIRRKEAFRNNRFYTKHMENKIEAIEKFMQKHLDTDDKVIKFFKNYHEKFAVAIVDDSGEQ